MPDDDLEGLTLKLTQATDANVRKELWEQLYDRFHRMARGKLNTLGRPHEASLSVVNELYEGIDRAMANPDTKFDNRGAFLGYVALSMRHLIVARLKKSMRNQILDDSITVDNGSSELTLTLHRHMEALSRKEPRAMKAFELRYFSGCSRDEIMEHMPEYRSLALLSFDLGKIRKMLAELIDRE